MFCIETKHIIVFLYTIICSVLVCVAILGGTITGLECSIMWAVMTVMTEETTIMWFIFTAQIQSHAKESEKLQYRFERLQGKCVILTIPSYCQMETLENKTVRRLV